MYIFASDLCGMGECLVFLFVLTIFLQVENSQWLMCCQKKAFNVGI